MEMNMAFWDNLEELHQTKYYVESLLERGINILIYVGANDWIA